MTDKSKTRMNLAAIKKVDPYAKDIVDSSSHVAFYTFNSSQNEWEKTDVEGVFFLYSRNAQPYYSIFINNRLNTNSFVEPITNQLQLQSQPPFLLYRNERSRIRGFWFYNAAECVRIGNRVSKLVKKTDMQITNVSPMENSEQLKDANVNIFKLLSKAQQEYNSQTSSTNNNLQEQAPCNVMNFFASAKPTSVKTPLLQKLLPNTLSVEQLEKQQRVLTPSEPVPMTIKKTYTLSQWNSLSEHKELDNVNSQYKPINTKLIPSEICKPKTDISTEPSVSNESAVCEKENLLRQLLVGEPSSVDLVLPTNKNDINSKPTLMPPTMFDKPNWGLGNISTKKEPLDHAQLVQAFSYLLHNDEEFVHKLHDAYLKVRAQSAVDFYQ